MNRRQFLKTTAVTTAVASLTSNPEYLFASDDTIDLIQVHSTDPALLVRTAVEKLGGMSRFISQGDKVIVKPNIGWDRNLAQGANTHPEVVAETIKLCLAAGASQVEVFDYTCNTAKRCYANSGIAEAAKNAGAKVSFVSEKFFRDIKIDGGAILKSWPFYKPALDADKYINVPVLKHHGLSRVTIGLKNIMGVIGGNRGTIHRDFDQKIADLNTVIKPTLTIVDATRILQRNGPTGGSLGDVRTADRLIAGIDPVAVDAAAAELFGIPYKQLGCLHEAQVRGLGKMSNLENMLSIDLES